MNHQRLSLLARVLDRVPREHFDLESWTHSPDDERPDTLAKLRSCGTTGCALGWACAIPSFKRQGLVLAAQTCDGGFGYRPTYRNNSGLGAGGKFFDIGYGDAEALFTLNAYPHTDRTNPRAVARRIRELLERDRKERGK